MLQKNTVKARVELINKGKGSNFKKSKHRCKGCETDRKHPAYLGHNLSGQKNHGKQRDYEHVAEQYCIDPETDGNNPKIILNFYQSVEIFRTQDKSKESKNKKANKVKKDHRG